MAALVDRFGEGARAVRSSGGVRGRSREQVLGSLGPSRAADAPTEVAPWWPFAPGPPPPIPESELSGGAVANAERPDAVLDGLEPLDVRIGGTPFVELLRPLYRDLSGAS